MRRKQSFLSAATLFALFALGTTAAADPSGPKEPPKRPAAASDKGDKADKADKGGDKEPGHRDGHGWSDGHEPGDAKPEHAEEGRGRNDGGVARGRDDDDGDDALQTEESAETHQKRKDFLHKSKGEFTAALKASGRAPSNAENEAIKAHWRRTMRLWRIRAIAEKLKDNEALAKVDALLAKADEKTKAKLQELRTTEGGGTK